jgi:hypothetical protein
LARPMFRHAKQGLAGRDCEGACGTAACVSAAIPQANCLSLSHGRLAPSQPKPVDEVIPCRIPSWAALFLCAPS